MRTYILFFCLILISSECYSQLGGNHVYDFLSSPGSARATALGGSLIMVKDGDIAQVQQNPALSNDSMDLQIAVNHIFHFAGIQEGMVAYGFELDSIDFHFHTALQYVSYGSFDEADPIGNIVGEFNAGEAALILGASKQLNERIHLGANLKFAFANYASQNGFATGLDLGAIYQVPQKTWNLAVVIQNIGLSSNQFVSTYTSLPFDVKLGFSKRLKYLPFRWTVTGHHLYQWNIRYLDPALALETDFFGNPIEEKPVQAQIDNLFRHLVFSGEFLFGKRGLFNLRFSYNHLRRQELKVSTFRSLGGFGLGFGMHIKRFQIDYGVGYYHLQGATNHLGIRFSLDNSWKK